VTAVGVNCTDPRFVAEILRRMASATDRPLLAYPNSGESYDAATKTWGAAAGSREGAAKTRLADHVAEWVEAGVRIIGGCCRTTPSDIKSIRAAVRQARHW
jgi:homocysteine S-methyltransferase